MERNISPAAILCIVLVSLACVIGIGYGAFAITKGSANDGTQEVATQTSEASSSWKSTYNATEVTGAQVQTLLSEADSRGIAVFVNTRGMCQETINTQSVVPVLKHNGKYYMNYGTVFDYEDDSYKNISGEVSMHSNSNLLGVRDGSSLKVDVNPKLQDGKIVRNKDYTGLYANGAVNFIDTHAKFRSNLIYGNNGEVVGVILSQVNRAGATLSLSSGGGFTNGSGAMGGTSGSYIPSHSGGGNIPMTGGSGSSTGGSSSSGGNSSIATPGSGANASGPSTKPTGPAPSVNSDEVVVTFDTRGGNVIDYQKLTVGFKATKPSVPVRNGYSFAGWYTDANCSSKFNFDSAVNKNITLYARWFMWGDVDNDSKITSTDASWVLSYESGDKDTVPFFLAGFVDTLKNPELGLIKAQSDLILKKFASGSKFPIETETVGYEFDLENGYYYNSTGEQFKIPVPMLEGKYTITFYVVLDSESYLDGHVRVNKGDKVPKPDNSYYDDYVDGCILKDWYIDSACTQKYDFNSSVNSALNLYGLLVSDNVIPAGATYYRGVTATRYGDYSGATDTWSAGDTFPTDVKSGDVYVCEDYEYRFNGSFNGYHWVDYDSSQDGWSVVVRDRSKNTYSDMLSSVNGKGVTNLTYAFFECKSLVNAPKLSDNALTMEATFLECYALKTAVIPNKVKILDNTFFVCSAMVTAPSIPNGVKSMLGTFACCDALVNGSTIPSSVTNIEEVYIYCPKLTGSIEINASALTNYGRAFEGTIEPIELSGTCPDLYAIAETDDNDNVFVKGTRERIPVGGTYYVGVTSDDFGKYTGATKTYVAGDYFPSDVQSGDVYVYEDYEYRFNQESSGGYWYDAYSSQDGWGVVVTDQNKNQYADMLSSINGKDVKNLSFTFYNCSNLINAPKLSENAVSLEGTFLDCVKLKSAVIPNKVKYLNYTFFDCYALVSAPSVPNSVESMEGTFMACESLVNGSTIPDKVTNIIAVYWYCPKLEGTIEINADKLTYYGDAFKETVKPIELIGDCPDLYAIAETDNNNNVTVAN